MNSLVKPRALALALSSGSIPKCHSKRCHWREESGASSNPGVGLLGWEESAPLLFGDGHPATHAPVQGGLPRNPGLDFWVGGNLSPSPEGQNVNPSSAWYDLGDTKCVPLKVDKKL
jgi:hypothetical protein